MRILLSLVVLASLAHVSLAKDGSATSAEGETPKMNLRELLNAYQVLYERQFHQPLPENQKELLAALPRFNSGSTLKAQRSADWIKGFQQDGEPNNLEEKEAKATTQIQKREITSEPPKEVITTTLPSTQSTATEVSNAITDMAPMNEMRTTEERMDRPPTSAFTTMTTKGPTSQADATVRTASTPVMGRKLTELHPEMKQAMEGKAKPVILQEVKASTKMTEMPPNVDLTQSQGNHELPAKMISSMPLPMMPKKENTAMETANPELGTTKISGTDITTQMRPNPTSPAPQPMGNSISLTRTEMKTDAKPKRPPMKMSNVNAAQMKARKISPLRKPVLPKKNGARSGMRPKGSKPMPKQLQRQQPNLKVLNHIVVPRTQVASAAAHPAKKMPAQNRARIMQGRRPQPLRRASAPGRTLPGSTIDLNQPTNIAARPPTLIVIRDGRIMELTEQQQRDLNMVLSAMGASSKEPASRRRAPMRRGRLVPSRQRVRQQLRP